MKLKISQAPLESSEQDTSLFNRSLRQIRGVFKRVVKKGGPSPAVRGLKHQETKNSLADRGALLSIGIFIVYWPLLGGRGRGALDNIWHRDREVPSSSPRWADLLCRLLLAPLYYMAVCSVSS